MRKKIIFATVMMLSILVVTIVATIAPTIAQPEEPSSILKNYGTGSNVYINVPQGVPNHPTNLQLRCFDFNGDSAFGSFDAILLYLYIPQRNSYNLVGYITDLSNTEMLQNIWKGTFIYFPTLGMQNVIKLAPEELEIYTDSTTSNGNGDRNGDGGNNDMLVVKLAKEVTITLPFQNAPEPTKSIGDLTFKLPPMTLKFRPIAESYFDSGANAKLPSGYLRQPIATMRTPAWVEETIVPWLGAISPLEVCGHIDYKFIEALTPPAT